MTISILLDWDLHSIQSEAPVLAQQVYRDQGLSLVKEECLWIFVGEGGAVNDLLVFLQVRDGILLDPEVAVGVAGQIRLVGIRMMILCRLKVCIYCKVCSKK